MVSNKNLEIQSLRGYAIVLTIVAHFGTLLPQMNPYIGYFWLGGGVDLFFCISGFVIARGMLNRKRDNIFHFMIPFLIKRIFRLWPAAFFWSLIVLLLSVCFNSFGFFGTFEQNLITAISAWFQVVNFKIVSCAYFTFSECSGGSPLRIYWSLSLEEQFYLVFPILLFFFGNKKIAFGALILFVIQFFLHRPWPSPLWFFRTDALCLGILIAYIHKSGVATIIEPNFLKNTKFRLIVSSLLCALLFMVAKIDIVWFYNGLVALVSGCLVYVASFDKGYFIKNKVVLTMASYVGERSYSMYLTHMISLVLTKELSYRYLGSIPKEGYTPIFIALVVLVITFIFSEFSYQFIEKPARNYGSQLASAKEKMLDITKGNN